MISFTIPLRRESIYTLKVCYRNLQKLIWKDEEYKEKRWEREKENPHLKQSVCLSSVNFLAGHNQVTSDSDSVRVS